MSSPQLNVSTRQIVLFWKFSDLIFLPWYFGLYQSHLKWRTRDQFDFDISCYESLCFLSHVIILCLISIYLYKFVHFISMHDPNTYANMDVEARIHVSVCVISVRVLFTVLWLSFLLAFFHHTVFVLRFLDSRSAFPIYIRQASQ